MKIELLFDGHICVGAAHRKGEKKDNTLALCEMPKKYKPGDYLPEEVGKNVDDFKNSALLIFTNTVSIDVIIENLVRFMNSSLFL